LVARRVVDRTPKGAAVFDKTKTDLKGFYDALAESKSLLVKRADVGWLERYQAPERPVDALLAFGCGVQHTPHLMLEAMDVFRVLGIDFGAVAGRQFCCGRPVHRAGMPESGERISGKTYERFLGFQPNVVVQWCGACMLQYLEVISRQTDPPFDVVHATRYLADTLREMGDRIPWKKELDVRVSLHTHREFLPQQDVDAASILEILNMIPGVEYVGPTKPPALGAPCAITGETIIGGLSADQYRTAQAELVENARSIGAQTVVTPYHKCQKDWSKFSSKELSVRQWMSLLAEALGVGKEDRFTTYWHSGDPREIVERSRAEWSSWGLTEADALDVATRHFIPEFAVDVHECDCGGTGCGSGGVSYRGGRLERVIPSTE
jgi:Fe-S oxidoreductase